MAGRWWLAVVVALVALLAQPAVTRADWTEPDRIRRLTEDARQAPKALERIFERLVRRAAEGDGDADAAAAPAPAADAEPAPAPAVEGDLDGDGDHDVEDILAQIKIDAEKKVEAEEAAEEAAEDAAEDKAEAAEDAAEEAPAAEGAPAAAEEATEEEAAPAAETPAAEEEAAAPTESVVEEIEEEAEELVEPTPAPAEEEEEEEEAAAAPPAAEEEAPAPAPAPEPTPAPEPEPAPAPAPEPEPTPAPSPPPAKEEGDDDDDDDEDSKDWGPWSEWSKCTAEFCGVGEKKRRRECEITPGLGMTCRGEPEETEACEGEEETCPSIVITASLPIPACTFNTDVQTIFARGMAEVIGIPVEHIAMEVPKCAGGVRRRRYRYRRRLEGDDDEESPEGEGKDEDEEEEEEQAANVRALLHFRIVVTLTDAELGKMGGGSEAALEQIRASFDDTERLQAELKKVADQIGDTWPKDAPSPQDTFSKMEVSSIDNAEDMDMDQGMKSVLFFVFVICLTLFVLVVLAIVVWLEWRKCKAKEPYSELSG